MPRPIALLVLAFVPTLSLGACATGAETTTSGYADDLSRLQRDCDARGGFLAPTGRLTGRPETENVCRIQGGGSRID